MEEQRGLHTLCLRCLLLLLNFVKIVQSGSFDKVYSLALIFTIGLKKGLSYNHQYICKMMHACELNLDVKNF